MNMDNSNFSAPAPLAPAEPSKSSGLAIASLILGILGFCTAGLTALLGLVFGLVALSQIRRSQGALKGRGFALAGTIVSVVAMLLIPIALAIALPAASKGMAQAKAIGCMNNMKQLALGIMMSASDNQERFPSSANWGDAIQKYVRAPGTFQCPASDKRQRSNYAFNALLSGVETSKLQAPATTVLLFESDAGWNASGGPELALKQKRHGRTIVVAFADGHSEAVVPSRFAQLRWEP
jgi:prepilin-type processing-associated H-X9-DG protein